MRVHGIIIALAAGIGGIMYAAPARADHQPVIAVPGNPQVPVIINGHDASWAMVEGDWGLYRAGQVSPTVYYPYLPTIRPWHPRGYYPFTGKRPRYGRKEIIPPANRPMPPRAEGYHRYWSTGGSFVPAQTDYPVAVPPPVIVVPRVRALD